ncbi:MAG: FtsW/RodA/SpoVE family cell cycle protein [Eubacterium sp.]|nr:FtsW/RodA/SpoVE family cell cycle protein [Eubacterium sp.]
MATILIEIIKYLMIIVMALYCYRSISVLRRGKTEEDRSFSYFMQRADIFAIELLGFLALYLYNFEVKYIIMFGCTLALYIFVCLSYGVMYKTAPKLVINHMCMLLSIGLIILSRLNYEAAFKQLIMAAIGCFAFLLVPIIIKKLRFLDKLTWVYALVGIGFLAAVAVIGSVSYGAKLSVTIAGISLQPSEFIKIVFVFFTASILAKSVEFENVVKATVVAAIHVLILVASKDLGAGLIFFMVYLIMLYAATHKVFYLASGLLAGSVAAVGAYFLFDHVKTRVIAWQDPFSVIDGAGYQVTQALFAIGSGGWFGSGLFGGSPTSIPVVEQDFIFAAISEEMGGIFAICLLLVCISCFVMFLNIAMRIKLRFYKYIALGLGCTYIFQVFLNVGGVTKFIPSTGVTLPLISYGGSSLLSTLIIFNIILGLYIYKEDEDEYIEKRKQKTKKRISRKEETVFTDLG